MFFAADLSKQIGPAHDTQKCFKVYRFSHLSLYPGANTTDAVGPMALLAFDNQIDQPLVPEQYLLCLVPGRIPTVQNLKYLAHGLRVPNKTEKQLKRRPE